VATGERTAAQTGTYEAEIQAWRQDAEDSLRIENGWLTLTGLYWLHEGENSVGSDPASDILLPDSVPPHFGVLHLHGGTVTLRVSPDASATIDGEPVTDATLRNDYDPQGLSRVVIGSVNFHVIKRADEYGIRVRDNNSPARRTFGGRTWYPVNDHYRVMAAYTPYPQPNKLDTATIVGIDIAMDNPGYVEFTLDGHAVRLDAFSGTNGQIWFVFKDTNAHMYPGGKFLYAQVGDDMRVVLDFNKGYNPPCAFTPYATCPLPPKQNVLEFPIEAGEIYEAAP
jgi:uncharacterized protein (DUF1684 family)